MTAQVLAPGETDFRRIVESINQLAAGRSNAVGTVTISTSVTSTTVSAINCGINSLVFLYPQSPAAWSFQNSVATNNIHRGSFLINHPVTNNAGIVYSWLTVG